MYRTQCTSSHIKQIFSHHLNNHNSDRKNQLTSNKNVSNFRQNSDNENFLNLTQTHTEDAHIQPPCHLTHMSYFNSPSCLNFSASKWHWASVQFELMASVHESSRHYLSHLVSRVSLALVALHDQPAMIRELSAVSDASLLTFSNWSFDFRWFVSAMWMKTDVEHSLDWFFVNFRDEFFAWSKMR